MKRILVSIYTWCQSFVNKIFVRMFDNGLIKIAAQVVLALGIIYEYTIYGKTLRRLQKFDRISDRSIDMWWATGFYFKKSDFMQMYFNLIQHIKDNWNYYRLIYQIPNNNYRNDFAFSIAIHILQGFQLGPWPRTMPGNMYMASDGDMLHNLDGNKMESIMEKFKF